MNNGAMWRGLAIAALVIVVAAAVGIGAYNEGVAQGIAQGGAIAAATPDVSHAYHGHEWHRPWGGGFVMFPLFVLFFSFFCLRGMLWRGPWAGGWRHRYYDAGVPPAFEEWHRRAHGEPPPKA